jgi:hypothetical protein
MADLEQLAAAIRADLRMRDDEDEVVVAARQKIAADYRTLNSDERKTLGEMLQAAPVVELEGERLMADLKTRRTESAPLTRRSLARPAVASSRQSYAPPIIPGMPRTRARPILMEPDALRWEEWTPTHPRLPHVAFRNHAFEPLGPPEISWVATWCQRCGRGKAAHGKVA